MGYQLSPGSRVWAYSRESGGGEQGIGSPKRAIERDCRGDDLVFERLFYDEARPGSSVAGREQFQEMMRLIRSLAKGYQPGWCCGRSRALRGISMMRSSTRLTSAAGGS